MRSSDWPMSKLLSDIASNTPEAIDVEQTRIRCCTEPVAVSGRARPDEKAHLSAQEVVTLMQDNLRKSGMFQEIHLNWGDPNNFGHYEFNLTAKVVNPYRPYDYPRELDFAAWTLAERLWGQVAAAPIAPAPQEQPGAELVRNDKEVAPPPGDDVEPQNSDTDPESTTPPRWIRPTTDPDVEIGPDNDVGFHSKPEDRADAAGRTPLSKDIPDPLSPEQIAAMGLAEAQEAFGHFSQAIQQGRVDAATRQRLWADWKLLRERVRDLKAQQEKEGGP